MTDAPAAIAARWRRTIFRFFLWFAIGVPVLAALALAVAAKLVAVVRPDALPPPGDITGVTAFLLALALLAAIFVAFGLALNWVLLVVARIGPRMVRVAAAGDRSAPRAIVGALVAMTMVNLAGNLAVLALAMLPFWHGLPAAAFDQGAGFYAAFMILIAPILCGIGWLAGCLSARSTVGSGHNEP